MGFFDTENKAVQFERLGDAVTGVVDGPYTERQATEFGSSKLKYYSDGRPWMMACVPLRTNLRDPSDPHDTGLRTLYVDKISMREAIVNAFKAAGARDIETGGQLTVQYVGDEPSGKGNPSKLFAAQYQSPVGGLGQELAGGNGQANHAAAQQVSQPAYAQQQVPQQYAPQQQSYPPMNTGAGLQLPQTAQQAYPAQVQQPPNLMPQQQPQAAQQAAPADASGQIAAIRAMSAAGMTAVQISQAVPTFTADAVQAVLGLGQ